VEVGEMKKRYIVVVVFAIAAFAVEGQTTDEDLYKAWAGATNVNPVTLTPQQLGAADEFDNDAPQYNMNLMKTNNDVWANWDDNGTPEKDYNFMLFWFYPPDFPDVIECRWEVRVDGGACVYFLAWDNTAGGWVELAHNNGGSTPACLDTDVMGYFWDYGTFLVVGNTSGEGKDRISCDVCHLRDD